MLNITNEDCMDLMARYPDGYFDLAIVDPPYGDGQDAPEKCVGGSRRLDFTKGTGGTDTVTRRHSKQRSDPVQEVFKGDAVREKLPERRGGTWAEQYGRKIIAWDTAPGKEYFDELFRVSRNQIIWGGNYFNLPPTRCFLIWRKLTISESFSMAMCEYAWTSFNSNAKWIEIAPQGKTKDPRFHPTQKPVALYDWILANYAQPGMKILDTHVGSASSLIACQRAGLEYWGFEIDPDYYMAAKSRLERETAQANMFEL